MILYPNAKINIGLRVIEKRADRYHNIETLFVPFPLCDILEIVESDRVLMENYGIRYELPEGNVENELCVKAFRLLEKDFGIPPVAIYLHKNIPVGAGLGGGSSDAAFVLRGLDEMFSLGLSKEQLSDYAARLGSDCPFFIENRPMFGEGRGEILTPFEAVPWLSETLSETCPYEMRLITPDIHISTAQAYAGLVPDPEGRGLRNLLEKPVAQWRNTVFNDFEKTAFALHPVLREIKEKLYADGAIYASMTGSGSAVYGIFKR